MTTAARPDYSLGGLTRLELALWSSAAAVIFTVHLAGAWYLQQRPVAVVDEPQGQIAVMIDLAPMAVAPDAVPQEMADLVDSSAAESVEEPTETITPDAAEPMAEPVEEMTQDTAEPVEDVVEEHPVEELPVEEVVPDLVELPLPEVAMAIPEPRPQLEEPKPVVKPVRETKPKTQKKPEPVKEAKPEKKPSPKSLAAQKSAQDGDTIRAPAPGQGAGKSVSPAKWMSRVHAHLGRRRPKTGKASGKAIVRFHFNQSGDVLSTTLITSSGDQALDEAAIKLVRRSSPIPAPPPAVPLFLQVPIEFK